jgi:hypothetical protein
MVSPRLKWNLERHVRLCAQFYILGATATGEHKGDDNY